MPVGVRSLQGVRAARNGDGDGDGEGEGEVASLQLPHAEGVLSAVLLAEAMLLAGLGALSWLRRMLLLQVVSAPST